MKVTDDRRRPFVLGLTGSIGMGKSAVAAMFAELGVPVFDADRVVHELQGPDGQLLPAIEREFPGTTGPEGMDRKAIGAIVFNDRAALARLEAIVHPVVKEARDAFLIEHAEAPLVVFEIPLLFEAGRGDEVDGVAVVSAPEEVQRRRVMSRPGMTSERLGNILARQMSDDEKRARADYLIDTSSSLDDTRKAVVELVDKLSA